MQIREFSKPVTSKQLNESIAQTFGYKINLEQFSDVQLEDARNKLRTKLSQLELSESFDSVLESPEYQKTRLFLDCINQEIMEREEGKCPKCDCAPCECNEEKEDKKPMKKKESKTESRNPTAPFMVARAKQLSVPDAWIRSALSRIKLGESDNSELKAELKLRYDLNESVASWILLEGEEQKAEIIMATKDMVDRVTGWLEDVAAMKAEQLLELLDSIRETSGSDVAQAYQEAVKPALESLYATLESSRQGLSSALSVVSGGEAPTMGTGGIGGPDMGAPAAAPEMPMGGGEEELPPVAAEVGREKRESIDYSRKLSMLLNSKKK